jgi:Fe-S-cluster containining protein
MNRLPQPAGLRAAASARKEENLRFRAFLKAAALGDGELDAAVRAIVARTPAFDCRTCGECCRVLYVSLTPGDTARLADSLGLPEDDFRFRYLVDMEGKDQDLFRDLPCPFQAGNLCSRYEARPENCRSYPHLGNEGFRQKLHNVFENYAVGPVVHFTVEELKRELGFAPRAGA